MKKFFLAFLVLFILIFSTLLFAVVDTKDGASITTATDIDGSTDTHDVVDGSPVATSCPPWYADANVIASWNGQGATHNTLYEPDGTPNEADTDTATTADIGGGVIAIVLDDAVSGLEVLRWSGDLYFDGAADQTICLKVQFNGDVPHDGTNDIVRLFDAGDGTDDSVFICNDAGGQDRMLGYFFAQGAGSQSAYGATLALNTPITIAYSWDMGDSCNTDCEHSANPGDEPTPDDWPSGWEEDVDAIDTAMTTASARLDLGNTQPATCADADESIYILQMALVNGYQFDCSSLTGWD